MNQEEVLMQGYDLEITVLGDPKAQGRPRAAKRGKFIQVYNDPQSRKAKDNLRAVIQSKAPAKPFDCPLQVDLGFYMPRPKGHYGTGKNANRLKPTAPLLHTSKPDIDNLRKLVMDAMTGVFWRDDALVCKGTTVKEYSDRPRTEIRVKKL
ncbi:MAG TPA: RusA family crossover junction endodeoxyribonuclease [Anaerohalosphaeraceae bacterium]|nr:RusA family crossover junction endodeoxyribonuclease [Anaerohalosphaeraceae bacterium]